MTTTTWPRRHVRTAQNKQVLRDLLQSLFAMELACPSRDLWLVAPWVSDIPLLDNTAGQFEALAPALPRTVLTMSTVLAELAGRGTTVRLLYQDAEHIRPFLRRLDELLGPAQPNVQSAQAPHLHEKCLLSSTSYLAGSGNFTFNALFANDEHMILHTDPDEVGRQRSHLVERWREAVGP